MKKYFLFIAILIPSILFSQTKRSDHEEDFINYHVLVSSDQQYLYNQNVSITVNYCDFEEPDKLIYGETFEATTSPLGVARLKLLQGSRILGDRSRLLEKLEAGDQINLKIIFEGEELVLSEGFGIIPRSFYAFHSTVADSLAQTIFDELEVSAPNQLETWRIGPLESGGLGMQHQYRSELHDENNPLQYYTDISGKNTYTLSVRGTYPYSRWQSTGEDGGQTFVSPRYVFTFAGFDPNFTEPLFPETILGVPGIYSQGAFLGGFDFEGNFKTGIGLYGNRESPRVEIEDDEGKTEITSNGAKVFDKSESTETPLMEFKADGEEQSIELQDKSGNKKIAIKGDAQGGTISTKDSANHTMDLDSKGIVFSKDNTPLIAIVSDPGGEGVGLQMESDNKGIKLFAENGQDEEEDAPTLELYSNGSTPRFSRIQPDNLSLGKEENIYLKLSTDETGGELEVTGPQEANPGVSATTTLTKDRLSMKSGEITQLELGAFLAGGVLELRNFLGKIGVGIAPVNTDPEAYSMAHFFNETPAIVSGSTAGGGAENFYDDQGRLIMTTYANQDGGATIAFINPETNTIVGSIEYNQTDGMVFSGDVKNFRMDDPTDPNAEIWYASLEGPEAGAYDRGVGQLVNGEAFIAYAEHFRKVINPNTVTVILTPNSAESRGLAVIEKKVDGILVKELSQGNGNYSFDWEVKGVRKGYEDYQVIRSKSSKTLPSQIKDLLPDLN